MNEMEKKSTTKFVFKFILRLFIVSTAMCVFVMTLPMKNCQFNVFHINCEHIENTTTTTKSTITARQNKTKRIEKYRKKHAK